MAAVNRNMFEASVALDQPTGSSLLGLPLNLMALIVSYVDDASDLARLCRASRVLNYMALPQLYRNLTLTSYDRIRYRDDQPEGMGSASPFTMGLNAVITRPYASLIQSLTLRGDWREAELEEHARVGRVPDSSMMLNIAVRAAIDRMQGLEHFSWELNTKMLETVYLGLAKLPKLTSLAVRFPSDRHPRPTVTIPPMPRLRVLKITDIDPLCYPDDISTLLLKSRKLRELKMHWSPRMRNEQEPSVMLQTYFRKCIAAKKPLAVRKIALQNLYALHSEDFDVAFDPRTVEDVTILNSNNRPTSATFMNTFVDSTWPTNPPSRALKIKSMRQDALSKRHCDFLGSFTGLQRLYFVNERGDSASSINSPRYSPAASSITHSPPSVSAKSPINGRPSDASNSPSANDLSPRISLRDSYLNNIIINHATTLRHLSLPAQWPVPATVAARLVHACPHLEQLAIAPEVSSMETLGLLFPFLRNLAAIRLLVPTDTVYSAGAGASRQLRAEQRQSAGSTRDSEELMGSAQSLLDFVELDDQFLADRISESLADKNTYCNLKVIGMGRKAWELCEFYTISVLPRQQPHIDAGLTDGTARTDVADPSGTESVEKSNGVSPPDLPNTLESSQTPSILGKRRRGNDSPISPLELTLCAKKSCKPAIYSSDGQVWRRRVRKVGWDVLKHWAIWALDTQDI